MALLYHSSPPHHDKEYSKIFLKRIFSVIKLLAYALDCSSVANSMFKDILSRKDDADAKRNALNVLQRFKFLFNLQRNIERNVQQVLDLWYPTRLSWHLTVIITYCIPCLISKIIYPRVFLIWFFLLTILRN